MSLDDSYRMGYWATDAEERHVVCFSVVGRRMAHGWGVIHMCVYMVFSAMASPPLPVHGGNGSINPSTYGCIAISQRTVMPPASGTDW